jgi:hypothetical protein
MASTEQQQLLDSYRTLEQLAAYLGMHPGSLRRLRLMRKGPPALKCGNRLLFPKDETERWLRSGLESGTPAGQGL